MPEVKTTAVLSQQVNTSAISAFNTLCNKLNAYAIAKGVKQPKKGDILSIILTKGSKEFDIENHFESK
jgi:hypothetical protein